MSWVRVYARRWLRPYMPYMSEQKAIKYMTINRLIYFFSATGLAYYTFYISYPKFEKEQLEQGLPVLQDSDNALAVMRKKGVEHGTIIELTNGKWRLKEYDREKYLAQLEADSFKKAQEAQKKALAEGKELPQGAINLVDLTPTIDDKTK